MTNKLRERFCEIVRDRALVPEPLLNECLREEAGVSSDGTNFPLIDLLLQKQLLEPPEIASILAGLGIDSLLCPICESRHPLGRCLTATEARLRCDSCGVPMQFLGAETSSSQAAPRPAAPADPEATLRIERRAAGIDTPTLHDPGTGQGFAQTLRAPSWPARPSSGGQAAVDPGQMAPGQVLDDRYEIIERLTEQQGVVYKALERGLDRLVAVKILDRAQPAGDRLAREIDLVGKLSHPNIITILNVGTIGPQEYFVLEYVEGTDLPDLLRAGALDFQEATRIARDLADALHHAHSRGLIHGTLSPSSIRIDKAGHPYLIDFCLAPSRSGADPAAYRAPELAGARVADESSDIYSLGAIYRQMVSGKPPSNGVHEPPALRADLPQDGAEICIKALDRDPARRHDSMQELRKTFDLFLESSKLASRRMLRQQKSRRSVATAAVLVLLLGAAVGAYFKWGRGAAGAGAGSGKPEGGDAKRPDPFAEQIKEVRQAVAAGDWVKAYARLQELKKKTKLSGDLEQLDKQLEVQRKAKELESDPEGLCRYLVGHALAYAKTQPFQQLVERNKLWQLVLEVGGGAEGGAPARVTLYPVDSLTLEVNREKPLELGQTPLDCPFINQQGYQVEVVRGGERLRFPLEFRPPIQDPTNNDRKKVVRLRLGGPPEMCLVPAISGAAFNQETGADRDFLIDRFETTCAEFEKFVKEMQARKLNIRPPTTWPGGRMPVGWERIPVCGVNYLQAAYHALWAGKRLPTRIEWNKAAGGQDQREYPWGSSFKDPAAVSKEDGFQVPQPVGGREAGESPYGVRDMSGNVWEIVVPTTPVNQGKMVIRGGSYFQPQGQVTISSQRVMERTRVFNNLGFRCARSLLTDREGRSLSIDQALADGYPGVVIAALARLSRSGGPEATGKLFEKLDGPDEMVRLAAAFYLMQQDVAALRTYLQGKLSDADPVNRLRAVRALELGLRPELVGLLSGLFADADDRVREAVYTALVTFRVAGLQAILLKGLEDKLPRIRQRSVVGLGAHPGEAVTVALRGKLRDPSGAVRYAAALQLLRRRDTVSLEPIVALTVREGNVQRRGPLLNLLPALGVPRLVQAAALQLEDKNVPVQRLAIELLAHLGAAQYTDAFLARIKDPQLATFCIFACQRVPSRKACQALLPLLEGGKLDATSLQRVLSTMVQMRHEAAVPALIKLVGRQDVPAQFKQTIVTGIGTIGGKQAQEFLFRALTTPNSPLARFAWQGFARSGHPQAVARLAQLRANTQRGQPQLVPVVDYFRATAGDKGARAPLLDWLRRADLQRTQNAAFFAQGLRFVIDGKQLAAMLESSSAQDRELAAIALGAGEELALDVALLERRLSAESSGRVRLRLLQAVSARGVEQLRPAVERLLQQQKPGTNDHDAVLGQLNTLLRMAYRKQQTALLDSSDPPKKQPPKKDPPKKQPPKKQPGKKQPPKKPGEGPKKGGNE